jgi:tetrahydromethanopterin S-methyltransferase subunit F
MAGSGGNILVGGLAGYAASRTMDAATSLFYTIQTDASKAREEELAPGGTLVQLGAQIGQALGRELTPAQAGRLGLTVHRTFGVAYGMVAARLVRAGVRPLVAGLAVGGTAWALVDEGTALPTFTDYPVQSHLRGVVGHGTLGLAIGLLLSLVESRDG